MGTRINKNKDEQEFFKQFSNAVPGEIKNYVRLSMDIASQINVMLENENLTQRDLAGKLGKKESEISKWLSGNHNFTLKSLAKIETVLDQQFLFTREEITDRFLPFLFRQFRHLYTEDHYNKFINFYCMSEPSGNNISFVLPEPADQSGLARISDAVSNENIVRPAHSVSFNSDNSSNRAA